MSKPNQHRVAAALRQYAEKIAAEKSAAGEGAPDRMTVADGQGGITASKASIPKDVGEAELKRLQPADGTARKGAQVPAGRPDRMTVADGQGGITASKASIPKDPGEAELKADQPADGTTLKAANLSKRAASIRAALVQSNPALAQRFAASAPARQPARQTQKQAGTGASTLDLSTEVLCKIARAFVSTDEGIRMAHDLLEKQAGEDAARAQILEAIDASHVFGEGEQIKQAAYDDLGRKVHEIHESLLEAGVTEAHADAIIKQAALHQETLASLDHPLLKAAYAQGMDDAALMAAADEAGAPEGAEPPADGASPADEALPMGGESLSEEEIMALLQEMLASGQITEEDILEAVQATSGGEGAAPEGMPEEAAV
jgi:hypothetical protein